MSCEMVFVVCDVANGAANDAKQTSGRRPKYQSSNQSVSQPGLRPLCQYFILLISLLSCHTPLCPGVSFSRPTQGQVVLCSLKPFFALEDRTPLCFDFPLIIQSDWNSILPYLLHIVELLRRRLQDAQRVSMELLDYGAGEWHPFFFLFTF